MRINKTAQIGIIIVCLALGVLLTVRAQRGSNESGISLICQNPACGKAHTLPPEKIQISNAGGGSMAVDLMRFECPFCGQQTAQVAEKCPKCGTLFVPDYHPATGYPCTCPQCGFSKYAPE